MMRIVWRLLVIACVACAGLRARAIELLVSYTGPLPELPVQEFAFTNLPLYQVVDVLSARLGIPHGCVYNAQDPQLSARRSLQLERTTLGEVVTALQQLYPEYTLTLEGRALVALPTDLEAHALTWLTQRPEYAFRAQPAWAALKRLLERPELVTLSNGKLPPSHPMNSGGHNEQLDADGDAVLLTRTYQGRSVLEMLNDLAFSNGESWTFSMGEDPIQKERWIFARYTATSSPYAYQVRLVLPASYTAELPHLHNYPHLPPWTITHLRAGGLTRLQLLDALCAELGGVLYVLVAADSDFLQEPVALELTDGDFLPVSAEMEGGDFLQCVQRLFPNYLVRYDFYSGVLVLRPYGTAAADALRERLETKLDARFPHIGGSYEEAAQQINAFFAQTAGGQPPIVLTAHADLDACAFTMAPVSWHMYDLTPLLISAGVVRKTRTSAVITAQPAQIAVTLGQPAPQEPYTFVLQAPTPR